MPGIITTADIVKARKTISPYLSTSPLYHSPALSEWLGREVYCKWESKHISGAFKERGALNFLLNLSDEDKKTGVCAASMGNHARALSLHSSKLNIPCTIVMPKFASLVKIQACEQAGANVILEGAVFDEALRYAQEYSAQNKKRFVHPFNDPLVMAGQGTCGAEITEQFSEVDVVVVPVGGGGLIAGIATAIKGFNKNIKVIGVQSEWALHHQRLTPGSTPAVVTIADGIAVKKIGDLTQKVIKERVDTLVAVSEAEIARAVVKFLELEKALVEGAAAASLAALMKGAIPDSCKRICLVVSGGNIDINLLSTIIQRDLVERGRRLRISLSVADRPGLLHQVSGIIAGKGANVVDVLHDRFSSVPGVVEIQFMLEVRDKAHGDGIVKALKELAIDVTKLG